MTAPGEALVAGRRSPCLAACGTLPGECLGRPKVRLEAVSHPAHPNCRVWGQCAEQAQAQWGPREGPLA